MRPSSPNLFFFLKHVRHFSHTPLKLLLEASQKYGAVVDLGGGLSPLYLMNHPDAVRHVLLTNADNYYRGANLNNLRAFVGDGLLTSNGDLWKRQRQLMQPTFQAGKMPNYMNDIIEPTEAMLQTWQSGEVYPMWNEMMVLTQLSVLRILFDYAAHTPNEAQKLNHHLDLIQEYLTWASMQEALFIGLQGVWGRKNSDRLFERVSRKRRQVFDEALAACKTFCAFLIQRKKETLCDDDTDLLAILVRDHQAGGMSEELLMDEVLTLFFAGYDTTGNSLSWTCWLLAQHPQVQAKLYEEVQSVLNGNVPTHQTLAQMPYLQAVIDESLRLYPVAWAAYRTTYEADQICGYDIPAKASIFVIPYLIQRHPQFWDEPDVFKPERFLEKKADDYGLSYFPFNAGRNMCVGRRLGILEMKIVLSMMLQRFMLLPTSNKPISPNPMITLYPSTSVPIKVQRR